MAEPTDELPPPPPTGLSESTLPPPPPPPPDALPAHLATPPPAPPEEGAQGVGPSEPGEGGGRVQIAGVVALVVALLASGFAYALPWLPEAPHGGDALSKLFPLDDGNPTLVEQRGENGEAVGFRSRTIESLSPLEALGKVPATVADALLSLVKRPKEEEVDDLQGIDRLLADADLAIEHVTRLDITQDPPAVFTSQFVYARTDNGLLEVGFTTEDGTGVRLDPPLLVLPPDPQPGDTWESSGTANEIPYTFDAKAVSRDDPSTPVRAFSGCLRVDAVFTLGEGETRGESELSTTYCEGVGEVITSEIADGTLVSRGRLIAADGEGGASLGGIPPAPRPSEPPPIAPAGGPGEWGLTRFARSLPTGSVGRSTIPPAFIATDPPIVLAAAERGDLVAFDAATADERWRFHPGGDIYGAPTFDPEAGRIYFGASDRRLYAIDPRGLFLWAFDAGDNIPTKPLVVDDTVIVGNESGFIYGVDAATGEERWSREAAGPVTGSPVLAGGLAVVGSDDGGLYAFEPKTGERRWRAILSGPVESAPAARGDIVYAADRDGEVSAINAKTGDEIWSSNVGATVRTPIAVTDDLVVMVTDFGRLVGLDRGSGRRRWQTGEIYEGAPVIAGDAIVVPTGADEIHVLTFAGKRVKTFEAAEASFPDERQTTFVLGGTLGGEAVWFADDSSVIRRLGLASGAPPTGFAPVWTKGFVDEPFDGGTLKYSPVAFGERALVLDDTGGVYLLDPTTGDGEKVAAVADGGGPTTDPVVDGDLLFVSTNDGLHAISLPDGEEMWKVASAGGAIAIRPPVVVGDTVLWSTFLDGVGSLQALERTTGESRWSAPTRSVAGGGIEVADSGGRKVVFTSTPPSAYDLATGDPVWGDPLDGLGLGGPVFDATTSTLFVGEIVSPPGEAERATVSGLDATTGEVRWTTELPTALTLFERLWVSDGVVVVPTLNGAVFGLDAATGEQMWAHEAEAQRFGTVTVDGASVLLVLANGDLQVLDVATGEVSGEFGGFDLSLDTLDISFARPVEIDGITVVSLGFILLGLEPVGG